MNGTRTAQCPSCRWRGVRVFASGDQVVRLARDAGFGTCPKCGAVLVKIEAAAIARKRAQAQRELAEWEAR